MKNNKDSKKYIGRATLIEIREQDYAQCYKDEFGKIHWITGFPRASGVKVGDTGYLENRETPTSLLTYFVKTTNPPPLVRAKEER